MQEAVWYEYGHEEPLEDFIKRLQQIQSEHPGERLIFQQLQGECFSDGDWLPGSMQIVVQRSNP